jgi:uncharacterized SAM-binding protein YcdF (DUF218 family)
VEGLRRLGTTPKRVRRPLKWISGICLTALAIALGLFQWGGYGLVANDLLPAHLDGLVVLQGSISGEKARIEGAVRLLQQGIAGRMFVSVPKESYWGQAVSPLAYRYIEKKYGGEIASRTDFCEIRPDVNSTETEANELIECLQQHGLNSVAVVTSDYHSRRSGIIWRRILQRKHSPIRLWVHGVVDPEFHAAGWWRDRLSAKTWLGESIKLLWTLAVG